MDSYAFNSDSETYATDWETDYFFCQVCGLGKVKAGEPCPNCGQVLINKGREK